MMVYCVFQRVQLNICQSEFVLQKVFATEEAAQEFCDSKPDRDDWVWEGRVVH